MADADGPWIDPEVWEKLYALPARADAEAPTPEEIREQGTDLSSYVTGMTMSYAPTPAPAAPFEPGVTRGWLVLRDRTGAYAAPAVVLADEDGTYSVESPTGDHFDMEPVEIRDDSDG
jgi:hypothetical protein